MTRRNGGLGLGEGTLSPWRAIWHQPRNTSLDLAREKGWNFLDRVSVAQLLTVSSRQPDPLTVNVAGENLPPRNKKNMWLQTDKDQH